MLRTGCFGPAITLGVSFFIPVVHHEPAESAPAVTSIIAASSIIVFAVSTITGRLVAISKRQARRIR